MKLKEAIEYLQKGTKHFKLIVVNQESKNCINECKLLNLENITKININSLLTNKLLFGKTQEEKENEAADYIINYLDSIDFNILILHDVEYMFSPDLGNFNVINFFKYYSRNGHIIVLFITGKLIDNYLIYSEEGYDDYKKMDISEVIVVGWD